MRYFVVVQISVPEADRHDTGSIYNKMTLRELSDMVPQVRHTLILEPYLEIAVFDKVWELPRIQKYFFFMMHESVVLVLSK